MATLTGMDLEGLILKRREEGCTHAEISEGLCTKFPGDRGFSSRRVRPSARNTEFKGARASATMN